VGQRTPSLNGSTPREMNPLDLEYDHDPVFIPQTRFWSYNTSTTQQVDSWYVRLCVC